MGWFNFKRKGVYVDVGKIKDGTTEIRQDSPAFNKPKKEINELPKPQTDTVKARLDNMYRKDHALDPIPNTGLQTVKERLRELKNRPAYAHQPLAREPMVIKAEPSPENLILGKVEKAIKRVELVRQKMEKTDSYLGHFYDLKAAEKEFIVALEEAKTIDVEFPEMLQTKINLLKSKIRLRVPQD